MEKTKRGYLRIARVGLGLGTLLGALGSAQAFSIPTENPDLKIRWDNTVRYTLGIRAKDCDINICGNNAGAGDVVNFQSDRKFPKSGDIVTNRIDLISEFDFIYKRDTGVRVSGAGWFDSAYDDKIEGDAALDAALGGAFMGAGRTGGNYSSFTKRWNRGLSGEFLDVFVFTGFNIGDVPVSLKLGQHTVYWGESLFSAVGGIAYNQSPLDFRKALANPGVEAKEVFKPLNQFSWSAQVTDELSLAGQYYFDWKPTALPDGGTYWGPADGFGLGGTGSIFGVPTAVAGTPDKKQGDWGLAAKWRPQWLDGNMGFFYREFTNTFPQLTLRAIAFIPPATVLPAGFGLDYSSDNGKREKLYGFSLGKQLGGVSFGLDLTSRPDAVLAATPFATYAPVGATPSSWVPKGDISTAVLNAIAYFGKTPVFDSAALTAEVNYTRLDKVTQNPGNFRGVGYNCDNKNGYACPTKDAWGMNILFNPTWFQVFDGVDVAMPIYFAKGLSGNSPVIFGDNEGQGSWSIGVKADVYNKYNFSLKYNGQIAKHQNDYLGAMSDNNAALGKYWDRDWISFTFKTSF